MGNRAIITTQENFENNGIGIYLHWNGGRDSVEGFLKYCELKGYRNPTEDSYGWARLCQIISNFFGGSTSIGINTISNLPSGEYCDNGVYFIEGWEIVGRKFFDNCEEQACYPLNEMLESIDERQPAEEQLGAYLMAEEVDAADLKVGDEVYIRDWDGNVKIVTILDFGDGRIVNGYDTTGLPYANIVGGNLGKDNCNNYIRDKRVKIAKRVA